MKKNNPPPVIGLAGGIGSGKSTIAQIFNRLGIQSIDADDVARMVVKPGSYCLKKIQQRYGSGILKENGELDRTKLRQVIFDDSRERQWLEQLTHPIIRREIERLLAAATSNYVLLVHPLLYETHQEEKCRFVIAIDVEPHIQAQRVIQRDHSSLENAQKIIDTQLTNQERIQKADMVLENTGNILDLNDKVLEMHQQILKQL